MESFEIIAIRLAPQENFTELTIMNENIAVSIQSVSIISVNSLQYTAHCMHARFHKLITTLVSLQVDRDDITAGISISVSEGEGVSLQYSMPCLLMLIMCVYTGSLIATIGNDSTLAPDEIASGFLPLSLFELFDPNEESIPIVLAVLRSGSLFSIEGNQGDVEGLETLVGSPVVSLTAGVNRTFINLPDPVIVNVRILVPVYS